MSHCRKTENVTCPISLLHKVNIKAGANINCVGSEKKQFDKKICSAVLQKICWIGEKCKLQQQFYRMQKFYRKAPSHTMYGQINLQNI